MIDQPPKSFPCDQAPALAEWREQREKLVEGVPEFTRSILRLKFLSKLLLKQKLIALPATTDVVVAYPATFIAICYYSPSLAKIIHLPVRRISSSMIRTVSELPLVQHSLIRPV